MKTLFSALMALSSIPPCLAQLSATPASTAPSSAFPASPSSAFPASASYASHASAAPRKDTVWLTLETDKPGPSVSPLLYGLMTEEINHSYDGGLYAELIQNRIFKDDAANPVHWSLVQDGDSGASIALDSSQPVNEALTTCLRLDSKKAGGRIGVANDGYWGIPVRAATRYRASLYAKVNSQVRGPLTITLESSDSTKIYARGQIPALSGKWQRYTVDLVTADGIPTTADARLVIAAKGKGSWWFNLVSVFPPTYHDRPNGNRSDIMEMLAALKPGFLRLPGGNYLEGNSIDDRFPWKKTLGGLEQRPGHPGCWKYRSSDGLGLLEFLEWCEDLHIQPVLAVFAGLSLKRDDGITGDSLQPFIEEALEEIEYTIGDQQTRWGRERAKDGHPEPFPMSFVEIGNEDWFDRHHTYDRRFAQFYDAIRAKYPRLQLIATMKVESRIPDLVDDHFYRSAFQMQSDAGHYDTFSRSGPKIFVGEWATREGQPTTNLNAALGDAAWMTGMERNADLVTMSCYAPLFVNTNPGAMQWKSDLIGFDALGSFGSPSYYVQQMFSDYLGDKVVPVSAGNVQTQTWQPPPPRNSTTVPPPKQVPTLFFVATRNTRTGMIYLKVVNAIGSPQTVRIDTKGLLVQSRGKLIVLSSERPEDTNSILEPRKILPLVSDIGDLGSSFTRTFAPYSVNVLQIQTGN